MISHNPTANSIDRPNAPASALRPSRLPETPTPLRDVPGALQLPRNSLSLSAGQEQSGPATAALLKRIDPHGRDQQLAQRDDPNARLQPKPLWAATPSASTPLENPSDTTEPVKAQQTAAPLASPLSSASSAATLASPTQGDIRTARQVDTPPPVADKASALAEAGLNAKQPSAEQPNTQQLVVAAKDAKTGSQPGALPSHAAPPSPRSELFRAGAALSTGPSATPDAAGALASAQPNTLANTPAPIATLANKNTSLPPVEHALSQSLTETPANAANNASGPTPADPPSALQELLATLDREWRQDITQSATISAGSHGLATPDPLAAPGDKNTPLASFSPQTETVTQYAQSLTNLIQTQQPALVAHSAQHFAALQAETARRRAFDNDMLSRAKKLPAGDRATQSGAMRSDTLSIHAELLRRQLVDSGLLAPGEDLPEMT